MKDNTVNARPAGRPAQRGWRWAGLSGGLASMVLGACCPMPVVAPTPVPTSDTSRPLVPPATASRPDLQTRVLPNGLKVYLLPDDSAPLVCVQFWVRAGSVDEYETTTPDGHGITGLSHFFEHLMFQGTARFPDYDRTLNPLGGRNNAFTYNDATAYWSYAPREHLPLLLDLEADRFEHMKVDFVHLEPEREVVKNERRLRVDADAAEVAEELATRRTFDRFPYRWGPIGWMSDLDAVTLEEAQAYHARYYRPDNTWLIISGSIDMQSIDALLERTWGRLPKAPEVSPGPLPAAESWRGERRDHLTREHSSTNLFLSWRAPSVTDAGGIDYAALELIDWALTAGKSGRISQALVYTPKPLATNIGASLISLRHPYVWMWRVELAAGATTRTIVDTIDAELRKIAAEGLTDDELQRARASLRADMVSSNLSHKDRAESVGFALSSTNDPMFLFARLDTLERVTADDVKRVAREWLTPETRVRYTLVPPSRYKPVVEAMTKLEPQSSSLSALLDDAFGAFVAGLDLDRQNDELNREERAIKLLAARGEKAVAGADADMRARILDYLDNNEMGTLKRRARLAAQQSQFAKDAAQHAATLKTIASDLDKQARRTRMNLRQSATATLIRALVQPSTTPLRGPKDVNFGTPSAIVLNTLLAFVADSRGDTPTGDTLRAAASSALAALDAGDARATLDAAGVAALLEDTTRANLPDAGAAGRAKTTEAAR